MLYFDIRTSSPISIHLLYQFYLKINNNHAFEVLNVRNKILLLNKDHITKFDN